MALVARVDDPHWEIDRGSGTLFIFLDLFAAFDNTDHGIPLDCLLELGLGGTFFSDFIPVSK